MKTEIERFFDEVEHVTKFINANHHYTLCNAKLTKKVMEFLVEENEWLILKTPDASEDNTYKEYTFYSVGSLDALTIEQFEAGRPSIKLWVRGGIPAILSLYDLTITREDIL